MPWEFVIGIIEPYYVRPSHRGRPQKEIKSLLKMMCLQQWYNLSDEAVEEQILDRLSFRDFMGLGDLERPIDATTLCNFRGFLTKHKLCLLYTSPSPRD